MTETLLILEDESLLGRELARHYRGHDWEVVHVASLEEGRAVLFDQAIEPLVVLADMSLPDGNALDLLEEARGRGVGGEWVILTAYGSVPDSVRAMQLGALDFQEKPCDMERLDVVIAGAARNSRAQRRLQDQAVSRSRRYSPEAFLGHSEAAAGVREMLARLAAVPFSALVITGETGTGKGLAARVLHHSGPRSDGPLVEVNCAALPRDLMESELFGHEAGAFTGARGRRRGLMEQAHGGTLFLDELAELDAQLQTKLLKAIEDQTIRRLGSDREIKVDVRIVAASNRDLETLVADGGFRSDLYHRLTAFRLHLPPLRERRADLADLVPHFIAEFNTLADRQVRTVPDSVWQRLRRHDWPGNVRELRNVLERCVLFAEGEVLPERWLQLEPIPGGGEAPPADVLQLPLDGSLSLEDMDRTIIRTALERNGFNATAAARALGTTRETLRYRIHKYGLDNND